MVNLLKYTQTVSALTFLESIEPSYRQSVRTDYDSLLYNNSLLGVGSSLARLLVPAS